MEQDSELMAAFVEETQDVIKGLRAGLATLETQPDVDTRGPLVHELFRLAHTLKGSADAVGFGNLKEVALAVEGVFREARAGNATLSRNVISRLKRAVSVCEELLELDDNSQGAYVARDSLLCGLSDSRSHRASTPSAACTGAAIVVAEDSAAQARLLKRILQREGHRVVVAENGQLALAAALAEKPDLVISDIVMPVMDGYQLCRNIKGHDQLGQTPVIMLTSLSDPSDVIKGLQCGADNFLLKPYKPEAVLQAVETVLAAAEAGPENATAGESEQAIVVRIGDRDHVINSNRRQILNLLLSSYENTMRQSRELMKAQRELQRLNEQLEEKVRQRTVELSRAYEDLKAESGERKRAQEALSQFQRMEAVNRMAAAICHDFNNILAAVVGFADYAGAKLPDAHPVHEYLAEIRQSADKGSSLTKQLLSFCRKQVLSPKDVDLNDVLNDVTPLLRRLIEKNVKLAVRTGPGLGRVKVDRNEIERVIVNIAANARDAMPDGGTLTIETHNVEVTEARANCLHETLEPGMYVMLAFTDTGIGVDMALLPQIFDPFFTTKSPHKGTGLGLSAVYGIVKQSCGFVDVSSTPGEGTTFRIFFPRIAGTGRSVAAAVTASGAMRVLLVAPPGNLQRLLAMVLERCGLDVAGAGNRDEAVRLAADLSPTLLVVEDFLPPSGMAKLVADAVDGRAECRVVLMVASRQRDLLARLLDTAIEHRMVVKPFSEGQLLDAVGAFVDVTSVRAVAS